MLKNSSILCTAHWILETRFSVDERTEQQVVLRRARGESATWTRSVQAEMKRRAFIKPLLFERRGTSMLGSKSNPIRGWFARPLRLFLRVIPSRQSLFLYFLKIFSNFTDSTKGGNQLFGKMTKNDVLRKVSSINCHFLTRSRNKEQRFHKNQVKGLHCFMMIRWIRSEDFS